MRQSELFSKARREAPSDEVSKNSKLLIRAGFIHKEMAGVYSFLPLGLRVLNIIQRIIREEMDAIGGQEVLLSSLQDRAIWEKTDRWNDAVVDNWFKTKLKAGGEIGLGFTHEEPITALARGHINSYRDLPIALYQIQTKFRNEERAKSGILRTREFLMKDLYSFSRDEEELNVFYEQCAKAYENIFQRAGIGEKTYRTFASGGVFSKYSHEFQTVCDAGEDTIYVHEGKRLAVNSEVYTDEVLQDLGIEKEELTEQKGVEVGNIFKLGTRFSKALGLNYLDEAGNELPVVMGSYGLGPARLMGVVVELLSDDKGLLWPKELSPFAVHLLQLQGEAKVKEAAEHLYDTLEKRGISVLYDDRDLSAGEKFAESDLLGVSERIIVSSKTVEAGVYEKTERASGEKRMVQESELFT